MLPTKEKSKRKLAKKGQNKPKGVRSVSFNIEGLKRDASFMKKGRR